MNLFLSTPSANRQHKTRIHSSRQHRQHQNWTNPKNLLKLSALVATGGQTLYLTTNVGKNLNSQNNTDLTDLNLLIYETDGPKQIQAKLDSKSRKPSEVHPHFRLLQTAKELPGIRVRHLGENSIFAGFSTKWQWVMEELKSRDIRDDDPVVVADNRDVLINLHTASTDLTPIRRFKDKINQVSDDHQGAPMVSGEPGCCVGSLTFAQPGGYINRVGQRTGRACPSGQGDCQWKYVSEARAAGKILEEKDLHVYARPWMSFQEVIAQDTIAKLSGKDAIGADKMDSFYLNMGLIAGRKRDLIAFIEALDLNPEEDDQAVATDYYFRFPRKIVVDVTGDVFGNNDWKSEEGCKFHNLTDDSSQLIQEDTARLPLFLHYPGFNSRPEHKKCLERNAQQLGHDLSATMPF